MNDRARRIEEGNRRGLLAVIVSMYSCLSQFCMFYVSSGLTTVWQSGSLAVWQSDSMRVQGWDGV
jgi:hypothetical protein